MALGFKKAKQACLLCFKTDKTPALVGTAGIGKTVLGKALAKQMTDEIQGDGSCLFVSITCSLLQEGDLMLPIPQQREEVTSKLLADILEIYLLASEEKQMAMGMLNDLKQELAGITDVSGMNAVIRAIDEDIQKIIKHLDENPNNTALLFLDELNRASVPVQAELMNLVLARELKGFKIDKRCSILVAMNPPQEMEGFQDTNYAVNSGDTAISDRMVFIPMEANYDDWVEWGTQVENNETLVDIRVIEFLDSQPNINEVFNQKEREAYITATPRSWDTTSQLLRTFDREVQPTSYANQDVLKTIIQGSVGTDIGNNFYSYLVNIHLHISLLDILNDTDTLSDDIIAKFTESSEPRKNNLMKNIFRRIETDLERLQENPDLINTPQLSYLNHNYVDKVTQLLFIVMSKSIDNLKPLYKYIIERLPLTHVKFKENSTYRDIGIEAQINTMV